MFILKKRHQPGVYVPLRALFLVLKSSFLFQVAFSTTGKVGMETVAPPKSATPESKENGEEDAGDDDIDIDAI